MNRTRCLERNFEEYQNKLDSNNEVLYYPLIGKSDTTEICRHDFFLLLLVESGTGIHTIDFIDHLIRPWQLHLVLPAQLHLLEISKDAVVYQFLIATEIFKIFAGSFRFGMAVYRKSPVFDLNEEEFLSLSNEFLGIRRDIENKEMFRKLVVARLFVIGYYVSQMAAQLVEDKTVYKGHPLLFEFLALIDKYYTSHRMVAFYAEKLKVTPNYLNVLCKKDFYCKATELVDDRVLLEAQRLLIAGVSIKETAFELNFSDVSYFSRYFKLRTAQTPKSFRDMYLL
ncbi:AraC family transcriptional regulator [Sphingobacterium sp. Ag1]|uniref:AraC family transcriptional regulator n=1 Tax=Sphingobacterium sp. Ag1 TaxID=1643451 RepID=UPI00069AE74E|nr:helix-turn-helix transcriptional regulator [Sphingobacterium sp. Ag1]